ncbi:DUF1648 domain-containing protein [Pseudarthrobacter sp. NPDC058196]|uniref:DUF1648 domain-containing protein n=1 Tax=Pseudarthrobacter sp. NPDC058196 TaxID=3346376 RepID=UPI0036DC617E
MALDAKNPASTMWFAASTAALLLTALYGLMLYPSMPDPVPVHWDGGGFPDRYAAKSGLAVFMPAGHPWLAWFGGAGNDLGAHSVVGVRQHPAGIPRRVHRHRISHRPGTVCKVDLGREHPYAL